MNAYPPAADGLLATEVRGDNAPAQSVSELSLSLKRTVEDAFGHVRVRGEISGFKRHGSGHCYFTLKDDRACMDAVIWKGCAQMLRFRPEDGIEVVATGKLTTYPGRSKYQIVVDRLELAGQGALMALLDKRRRALAAEGLFDGHRKRRLPFLPGTIGVVTSPTGAVIRDILHRLADRCPSHVIVWPVAVQGEGAAAQIAAAVRGFNAMDHRPDLLIVARGGGSIEDLWAFNEEEVVRAVAASEIPTISAVGHETDTTLCDFAADIRAPTPTAAAEMAVPVRADLLTHLREAGLRMTRCTARTHDRAAECLEQALRRWPERDALLAPQQQRLDDMAERLPRALSARLGHARADLNQAAGALRPSLLQAGLRRGRERLAGVRLQPLLVTRRIEEGRRALAALSRIAAQLHPDKPLEKGYARVEDRSGNTLISAAQARGAGRLRLVFAGPERVEVSVGDVLEPPPRRPYSNPKPEQPKLL